VRQESPRLNCAALANGVREENPATAAEYKPSQGQSRNYQGSAVRCGWRSKLRLVQILVSFLRLVVSVALDFSEIISSAIGFALTLGLTYYSVRTIGLFKSNVAARAWVYISLSAIFFGIGVALFLVTALGLLGLLFVGGIMETIGAFFLLLGLRKNFLFWASKDHFN
jgi:hypothetical protein